MNHSLAVFINTSDGFEDSWSPFFTLFSQYGKGLHNNPVYLNTERKQYDWPDVSIRPTCVWPKHESVRPSWSECLKRGLEQVEEPFVLYMQEDYYLTNPVDTKVIQQAMDILQNDESIGVVYLNKYGPQFSNSSVYTHNFVEVHPPGRYLVSTQAAIWRKDFLYSLIYQWENGWMFEKFSSIRVKKSNYRILSVNKEIMKERPVVDYIYTGIMKGKWNRKCVQLFDNYGINVDFTQRGFYLEGNKMKSKVEVIRKIISNPVDTIRSIVTVVRF